MACPHNQAKIDLLEQEIKDLNENIKKCEEIILNHLRFKTEINCVMSNLEGNYVKRDETYDNGKMEECYDMAQKSIDDASLIITESKTQISLKEEAISLLQGNCSACSVENEKPRWG